MKIKGTKNNLVSMDILKALDKAFPESLCLIFDTAEFKLAMELNDKLIM